MYVGNSYWASTTDSITLSGGTLTSGPITNIGRMQSCRHDHLQLQWRRVATRAQRQRRRACIRTDPPQAYVQNGGAIINTNGYNTTISQALLDGGGTSDSLTMIGPGQLTLSGANTYAGGTTVSSGTLAAEWPRWQTPACEFGNNSAVSMANTVGPCSTSPASIRKSVLSPAAGRWAAT